MLQGEGSEFAYELPRWFSQPPGSLLLASECRELAARLPRLFGYRIFQLGMPHVNLLTASPAVVKYVAGIEPGATTAEHAFRCRCWALPVADGCMDGVVLAHVLEFVPNPHEVLREVNRILADDGFLVILGFNPWGWWGVGHLLHALRRGRPAAPWCGHLLSLARLYDWLALLGLERLDEHSFHYWPRYGHGDRRPGAWSRKWTTIRKRLPGSGLMPGLGGAYLLLARKRVIPLTPLRERWRRRSLLIPSGGWAEPGPTGHVKARNGPVPV